MTPIPAAQYLRMSTEHQQYSQENQSAAIRRYAADHDMVIVHTYQDCKTGLVLNRREGLRQLLHDVVQGEVNYKIILVFDVSRWGRFQDVDEAAHYEFLCRSAGIPVHYCAESFPNDNGLPNMIMKALKRMMASEYSRELSARVYAGSVRLAQLGFRQGSSPGYGFRRMLLSPTGNPKHLLGHGERKSIHEDRVTLVLGPQEEVDCVREIFRSFVEDRKSPARIARELNARGVKYNVGRKRKAWYAQAIYEMLHDPKYIGTLVYGKGSQKLHTARLSIPRELWVVVPAAWMPIIDNDTFDRAQQLFLRKPQHKSDADMLTDLRNLWIQNGRISASMITRARDVASLEKYERRFGSLTEAFARIGYKIQGPKKLMARRGSFALRADLIKEIVECATSRVIVSRRDYNCRPRLRLVDRSLVSVQLVRSLRNKQGQIRWRLNVPHHERDFVTLIARLNANNDGFHDFHVVANLKGRTRCTLLEHVDRSLKTAYKLDSLTDLVRVVQLVRRRATRSR